MFFSKASQAQQWACVTILGFLVVALYLYVVAPVHSSRSYAIAASHDRATIDTLSHEHLPRSSKAAPEQVKAGKRLIFIGDIHGCMDELQALLAKVKYKHGRDHIIALGDMINKGPDSKGVVDFLIDQGASAVRGNHEDHILRLAKSSETGPDTEKPSLENTEDDAVEVQLAQSFTRKQLAWLRSLPVVLRIGNIAHHGDIIAVHGGLVPEIPLEDQSAFLVMNMRTIKPSTHEASEKHERKGYIPWAKYWDKHQKSMDHSLIFFTTKKIKHTTVVFGHDARKCLQHYTYAKGLDTSCVKGNQLTAWVVGDYGKDDIVQVQCQKHW